MSPHLLMILPPLFWAGNAIAGRLAVGLLPPMTLALWRWAFALLMIAPFGLPGLWRQRDKLRGQFWLLAALSFFSVTLYNSFLYLALTSTTALNATLITAALPVAILALTRLWLKTPITLQQSLGMAISAAGVLLVIGRGDPLALLTLRFHSSDLWLLAAVASWALYSVLLRRSPTGLDPLVQLTVQVILGFLLLLPLSAGEVLQQGLIVPQGWAGWGLIGYVALFPSLLAYGLWNIGVARLGPGLAGQYSNLIPVFTALLGVVLLGEALLWFHLLALGLILGGIWLASRS